MSSPNSSNPAQTTLSTNSEADLTKSGCTCTKEWNPLAASATCLPRFSPNSSPPASHCSNSSSQAPPSLPPKLACGNAPSPRLSTPQLGKVLPISLSISNQMERAVAASATSSSPQPSGASSSIIRIAPSHPSSLIDARKACGLR